MVDIAWGIWKEGPLGSMKRKGVGGFTNPEAIKLGEKPVTYWIPK